MVKQNIPVRKTHLVFDLHWALPVKGDTRKTTSISYWMTVSWFQMMALSSNCFRRLAHLELSIFVQLLIFACSSFRLPFCPLLYFIAVLWVSFVIIFVLLWYFTDQVDDTSLTKHTVILIVLSYIRINPSPAICPTFANSTDADQLASSEAKRSNLHCLPFSIWIYINNLNQAIWLAENLKRAEHLNLFSRIRVKDEVSME